MKIKDYAKYLPYAVFVIALLSTITSIYFSDIMHFVPCKLCWYQRIFMFPIVIISAVSIIRKSRDIHYYVLPLSILGFSVALYQNLLVWHILPEVVAPCSNGISCITQPFTLFGVLTIPLGSMFAFALITASVLLYALSLQNKKKHHKPNE